MIKQRVIFVLLTLLFLLLESCIPYSQTNYSGIDPYADHNTFWAYNLTQKSSYQIPATKRGVSNRAIVFVADDQLNNISVAQAQAIADEFTYTIYPTLTKALGPPADVDGNGLIVILCLDILDGSSGGGYIAGYFDASHEFSGRNSNATDMLFMDSEQGAASSSFQTFYQTIAHEFGHLIQFNQQQLVEGGNPTVTWINEGIAEIAQHLVYSQITSDTNYYTSDPGGIIKNGLSLPNWISQFANYTQSYIYMAYVMSQAASGSGFFKKYLAHSDNAETGFEALLVSENVGLDFKSVYQKWLVATYQQTLGINSYNNVISFAGPPFVSASTTHFSIKPYAALFLKYNSPNNSIIVNGATNMSYVGINGSGLADLTSPFDTTGDGSLVVYNSDESWRTGGGFSAQYPGSWPISNYSITSITSSISAMVVSDGNHPLKCGSAFMRENEALLTGSR